jgi:hypothetical protein
LPDASVFVLSAHIIRNVLPPDNHMTHSFTFLCTIFVQMFISHKFPWSPCLNIQTSPLTLLPLTVLLTSIALPPYNILHILLTFFKNCPSLFGWKLLESKDFISISCLLSLYEVKQF